MLGQCSVMLTGTAAELLTRAATAGGSSRIIGWVVRRRTRRVRHSGGRGAGPCRGRHAGWLAQHRRDRCGHDGVGGCVGINGIYRRGQMALRHDADAYRQVKDAWKDATEARQIVMLDDLRDLLDGIGFADDEYELREKVERLITDIEDDLGIDDSRL